MESHLMYFIFLLRSVAVLAICRIRPRDLKNVLILGGLILVSLSLIGCSKNSGDVIPNNHKPSSPAATLSASDVTAQDSFVTNDALWFHGGIPASHEVALFRRTFTLTEQLTVAELCIFADTRYEVWVDGKWIGRGPARFSKTAREFDIHQLGTLSPGRHLVAVLAQWAPNNRRSESVSPFLMLHIQGNYGQDFTVVIRTDSEWKAWHADAWKQDAVSVHAWELIGPTELVDLRHLADHWMSFDFDDDQWPRAVVKGITDTAVYQPRSIPLLANVPFTPTLLDSGLLSPGRVVVEFPGSATSPYTLAIESVNPTELYVEALTGTLETILFDGHTMSWQSVGERRPDVYIASTDMQPGSYSLSLRSVPLQGATLAISTQDVNLGALSFQQGVHAGRRLLLAEFVGQSDTMRVLPGMELSLEFTTLPAYVVLDLGRVIHGRLMLEADGAAGTVVDIGWDERLLSSTQRPLPYPGSRHSEWAQVDSWILDGTSRTIATLDARAGRYILMALWGTSPVQLKNIRAYEERYPVIQRGWFTSSNDLLNEIWSVGVDTLYPNMTDAYTDTPWRERGQWWGDAYVSDHINRVAFGDTQLLRRGLWYMAEAFKDGTPPALAPSSGTILLLDYDMLWVQSLYEYYQVTGDTEFLSQIYMTLREFIVYLEGYNNPDTGLLEMPDGEWYETALIDWRAKASRYGQSTALNAMYYGTLRDAASIAQAMGDSVSMQLWKEKADFVKEQVNTLLYLPAEHRYAASLYEGRVVSPTIHAQAWALAYGLVPENEIALVASSMLQLPFQVEIYGLFWVLEAMGMSGNITAALDIIQTKYGEMLRAGATTWWEGFGSGPQYKESMSHAWGGSPTWFLTTYVLGGRRVGRNQWTVKPAFGSVQSASGALPLQDGELVISWEPVDCRDNRLKIESPTSSFGELVIVVSDMTVLTLDQRKIWENGNPLDNTIIRHPDGVHIKLSGGSHEVYVSQGPYDYCAESTDE